MTELQTFKSRIRRCFQLLIRINNIMNLFRNVLLLFALLLLGACYRSTDVPQNLRSVEVKVNNASDEVCLSDYFSASLVKLPHVDSVLVGEITRIHNKGMLFTQVSDLGVKE